MPGILFIPEDKGTVPMTATSSEIKSQLYFSTISVIVLKNENMPKIFFFTTAGLRYLYSRTTYIVNYVSTYVQTRTAIE